MMNQMKYVQVRGLRNSGTNYLENLMCANTPLEASDMFGWKHGDLAKGAHTHSFNPDGSKFYERYDPDVLNRQDILILVIYRNPITWLQSIHDHAHGAPQLHHLSMTQFMRTTWRSYVFPPGPENRAERKNFLVPENQCEEYSSVIEMRNKKIQLFETFKDKVKNICYLNYEHLVENPKAVVEKVGAIYNIPVNKSFVNIKTYKDTKEIYKKRQFPCLSFRNLNYLFKCINWNQENEIGYGVKSKNLVSRLRFLLRTHREKEDLSILRYHFQLRCYKEGHL